MMMINGVVTANVEPSSVVFSMIACRKTILWKERGVKGVVDKGIDLSYRIVALHLLEKAANVLINECPPKNFGYINVYLCRDGEEIKNCTVKAMNHDDDKLTWSTYSNREEETWHAEMEAKYRGKKAEKERIQREKERLAMEAKEKIENEKRRREIEARRAEEERKKQEVRKRYEEFVRKHGVKEWPSPQTLSANPFVYEGKTVAIVTEFAEMLSPTQGLFANDKFNCIVVSDIPKGLFTSQKQVVLAGRVLGKTEVKLPLLGMVSVPHLKFVGVHFCTSPGLTDTPKG